VLAATLNQKVASPANASFRVNAPATGRDRVLPPAVSCELRRSAFRRGEEVDCLWQQLRVRALRDGCLYHNVHKRTCQCMHRRALGFTEATDILVGNVNHERIAEAAGVSVQSIRQARLDPRNPNYRSPPGGWEAAVARLALARSKELKALASELEKP